jgi:hypothetical protein
MVLLYLYYFVPEFVAESQDPLVNRCQDALHPNVNSLFSFEWSL